MLIKQSSVHHSSMSVIKLKLRKCDGGTYVCFKKNTPLGILGRTSDKNKLMPENWFFIRREKKTGDFFHGNC